MESVGQPCHNFQILGIARFVDPQDGREKVVLANFAAGATGTIIIIDPSRACVDTGIRTCAWVVRRHAFCQTCSRNVPTT